MNTPIRYLAGFILEDQDELTLDDLCRASPRHRGRAPGRIGTRHA
jgi:hypothetical protein